MKRYSIKTGWHEMSAHFPDTWLEEDPCGECVKYEDVMDKFTSMYLKGKEDTELRYEQKCSECNGTGKWEHTPIAISNEKHPDCPDCHGTGNKPEASDPILKCREMILQAEDGDYTREQIITKVKYFTQAAIEPTRQSQEPEQTDFYAAWIDYIMNDETDWSGMTEEKRYLSVAKSFWNKGQESQDALFDEAIEKLNSLKVSMGSYVERHPWQMCLTEIIRSIRNRKTSEREGIFSE